MSHGKDFFDLLVIGRLVTQETEILEHLYIVFPILEFYGWFTLPHCCEPSTPLCQLFFPLGLSFILNSYLFEPFWAVGVKKPPLVLKVEVICEESPEHSRGMICSNLFIETDFCQVLASESSFFLV